MPIPFKFVNINQHKYPFFELSAESDTKQTIHFTGANGFPAAVYESFLKQFTADYFVTAAECRGALKERNTPPKPFGFSGFADDLIAIIEATHSKPVIGMGHSFGAHISLIAAAKRPDIFEKLVLIEPASLPNPILDLFYRKLPKVVLHRMMPMIKKTQARQRVWPSREAFHERYRSHRTFKYFTRDAMKAYAEHGLYQRSDGKFELVFDPDWEAYIFSNVDFVWKNLKKSKTPCLFLRGEHSNLYSSERFHKENKKLGPHFTGIEVEDTHHLMPLEAPEACHAAILNWL